MLGLRGRDHTHPSGQKHFSPRRMPLFEHLNHSLTYRAEISNPPLPQAEHAGSEG